MQRGSFVLGLWVLACGSEKQGGSTDGSPLDSTTTETTTGVAICAYVPDGSDVECAPGGPTRASSYIPSYSSFPGLIDELCTVAMVTDDGKVQTIALDCPILPRDVRLETSSPHVPVELAEGSKVHFRAEAIPNGDAPSYAFMLRDEMDRLLVAGIEGPTESLALEPLHVKLRRTTCELHGGTCEQIQDGALEVTLAEASVLVFGGREAEIGTTPRYRILVEEALREECYDPECTPVGSHQHGTPVSQHHSPLGSACVTGASLRQAALRDPIFGARERVGFWRAR